MARPQAFDLDDLATAGLDVAERDGWAGVSVRSVADQVGVTPMALYRLAPDADRLRRVIADRAALSIQPNAIQPNAIQPNAIQPNAVGGDLVETLRTWARRAYRHLGRHRGLATYVLAEWTELPSWLDIFETLLASAASEGTTGPAAVAKVNTIYAFTLVRSQLRDLAAGAPRRQLAPVRRHVDRYPLIHANISEFTIARTDKHFAIGLDVLLSGLGDG